MADVRGIYCGKCVSTYFAGQELCSLQVLDGKLLLMTPVDPAFLLIPVLEAVVQVCFVNHTIFTIPC